MWKQRCRCFPLRHYWIFTVDVDRCVNISFPKCTVFTPYFWFNVLIMFRKEILMLLKQYNCTAKIINYNLQHTHELFVPVSSHRIKKNTIICYLLKSSKIWWHLCGQDKVIRLTTIKQILKSNTASYWRKLEAPADLYTFASKSPVSIR